MPSPDVLLWDAVTAGDLSAARRAVGAGGNVRGLSEDGTGKTLLHQAAFAGALDVFRFLVENGADPKRPRKGASSHSPLGPTPLHYAARYNRFDIVRYLVRSSDCDINAVDDQGFTALYLANKLGYFDIVDLLEGSGGVVRGGAAAAAPAPSRAPYSHGVSRALESVARQKPSAADAAHGSSRHPVLSNRASVKDSMRMRDDEEAAPRRGPAVAASAYASDDDWRWNSAAAISNPTHNRQSARHDSSASTQNVGNVIGNRSSVRQSKLYRVHESGNIMKSILGKGSLSWDVNRQQGAYTGPVYDATK